MEGYLNLKKKKDTSCICVVIFDFLSNRSRLGQFESRGLDVHRVLRHPQEPGHPPVPCALPGPGQLAGGAQHGDDRHRERHGQQRVGGGSGGIRQARKRQHQVSSHLQIKVLPNEALGDYRKRQQQCLLSINCHLLATHISTEAVHTTTLHKKHRGSINVSLLSQKRSTVCLSMSILSFSITAVFWVCLTAVVYGRRGIRYISLHLP